ncbi:MAG: MBL fold metallo-hydrolase [Deltaproteobacteria bacterium]|nr:MBL fold metallo-hydrolase [Candidatus Desulfobacula maris]
MRKRWLESLHIFTCNLYIFFFVCFLIGCSSFSRSELWAGDKPSHHTENAFQNYPLIEPPDAQGFRFIWNKIVSSSKSDKIPADHLIDKKRAIDRYRKLENEDTVTWIGQSTALLKINGKVILTDPFFAKRAGPGTFGPSRSVPPGITAGDLPAVNIIVISHNHYDHLDADFVESLPNKKNIDVVVPLGIGEFFRNKDYIKIHELDWHHSVTVKGLKFTSHPMVHYSSRGLFDKNKTLWCSWSILSSNKKLFFAGDTAFSPTIFKEIGTEIDGFDYALLPIGTYGNRKYGFNNHMNPMESFQAGLDLKAQTMIAIHWGTIDLSEEPLFEPAKLFKKVAMEKQFDPKRLWILKIGDTRVLE